MSEHLHQKECDQPRVEEMSVFFDARAEGYDRHMKQLFQDQEGYYKAVAGRIRQTEEPVRILDLGCGTGYELHYIFERAPHARIIGIDMSAAMLDRLSNRYPKQQEQLELRCGSYTEVPLGKNYDYVVSVYTMHHLLPEIKQSVYGKIYDSLKPGGLYVEGDCIAQEPVKEQKLLERYYDLTEGLSGEVQYHVDIPLSLATQEKLLLQAGFTELQMWQPEAEAAVFCAVKPSVESATDTGSEGKELLSWVSRSWNVPFIDKAEQVAGGKVWGMETYGGGRWILKHKSGGERQAGREDIIHRRLAECGIAAPAYVPDRWNKIASTKDGQCYVLYKELTGRTDSEVEPQEAEVCGAGLALLHQAMKGLPAEEDFPVMELGEDLAERVFPAIAGLLLSLPQGGSLQALVEDMSANWLPLLKSMPVQPIHRDAHPGNMVLSDKGEIGFLDFEISTRGIRLFDLCYFATSQWMRRRENASDTWLLLTAALRVGYERISPLEPAEKASAFYVMCAIQFIFAAYFQSQGNSRLAEANLEALVGLLKLKEDIARIFR
jgi:tRNA (cmo5U34)-methyltransferase